MMTKWFSTDSAYFFKINKAAIEKSSVCPIFPLQLLEL